jgi:hypothetical protein
VADREPIGLRELLERLLANAAGELDRAAQASPGLTPLQRYLGELHALCQRVIGEADEETARTFFAVLIEVAARHGRRAGRRSRR